MAAVGYVSSRVRFPGAPSDQEPDLIKQVLLDRYGSDFPSDPDERLLDGFLRAAEQGSTIDTWLPLVLIPTSSSPELAKLPSRLILESLKAERYRFVTLAPDKRVLLCSSTFLPSSDSSIALDNATHWLAEIHNLIGPYASSWLHIHVLARTGFNYTVGYNVNLSEDATASPELMVHELVHTYNSHLADEAPTFITEGIPEFIAGHFTGRVLLLPYSTGAKVRLSFRDTAGSRGALEEGGNGYLFFRVLAEVLTNEILLVIIGKALLRGVANGLAFLRLIKEHAVDPEIVERIYVAFIEDYQPRSA